jgi:hypothetical protein
VNVPGKSAPSLHRHPSEQQLHHYYEPIRQRAPHRYSMPPVSAVGTLPLATRASRPEPHYRRSPSHVPYKSRRPRSRRLHAGHRLARTRDTRQTHPEEPHKTPSFDAN